MHVNRLKDIWSAPVIILVNSTYFCTYMIDISTAQARFTVNTCYLVSNIPILPDTPPIPAKSYLSIRKVALGHCPRDASALLSQHLSTKLLPLL